MGDVHQWNAGTYEAHGRFVSDHGNIILNWLDAREGERILDAGCGDGALTALIAKTGAEVEGIELSSSMAEGAAALGLNVRNMDLLELDEVARYDAVFSNAVLHWIGDWDDLFSRFARSLKPGGRLVVECGGHGNIAAIRTAICAAASYYDVPTKAAAEQYLTPHQAEQLLRAHGFSVEKIELAPRRTFLKTGMDGWIRVFRQQFIDQFEGIEKQDAVMERLLSWLEPQLRTNEGEWFADYVRLRFIARLA